LAVNCTSERQQARLALPAAMKLVASDFGPMPKISGKNLSIDFPPLGYAMVQLD
jgi:hypothetical protein